MINVLSIDWDYFINAEMDTRVDLFPDTPNEDFSLCVQNSIWQSRYVSGELNKIGVIGEIPELMNCLRKHLPKCEVMITRSHKYAYDFLKDVSEPVNLVNVDFHHDLYTDYLDELNCGNWLCKVIDEHQGKYTWVARKTSDMDIDERYADKISLTTDFNNIKRKKWDMIFICRSDMWSPPHLDDEFLKVVDFTICNAKHIKGDKLVTESRYNQEFKDGVKQMKDAMDELRKRF